MRDVAIRATIAAAALSIALGAVAVAASPVPGTLGLTLTPAPVHVDDGARTITAINASGGLPLHVTLTASAGYSVDPEKFTLAPDASRAVAITAVDPERDGTLSAVATADVAGAVRSAISLTTRFLHRTLLEKFLAAYPWAPAVGLTAALLAVLGLALATRRRREP